MLDQNNKLLVDKITNLMKSSLFSEAIEILNNSIKEDNSDFKLYFLLGTAYLQINNLVLAEENLKNSIKLNEKFIGSAHNLGVVLNLRKNFSDAKIQFLNVLKMNSNNLDTLIELGRSYQLSNDFELAKKYYEDALEIDPNNIKANGLLGRMNLNTGFHKDGLKHIKKAQGLIRFYDKNFEVVK